MSNAVVVSALRPWRYRLLVEALGRWLIRGAASACLVVSLVLLVGWVVPQPESELRPLALQIGLVLLLAIVSVACVPRTQQHTVSELDQRLRTGDRIATAWAFRDSEQIMARLQREDALHQLERRPTLTWRPSKPELAVLGASALVALLLILTPSPQQRVLEQRAAEELSVDQATQQLDALRAETVVAPSLTPEQARQLDELLRQAQAELKQAHTQQEASAALGRVEDQVAQLSDPNGDLRDEALASMSETLAAEPRTRALASALQREDPQATSSAVKTLAAQADQLADVERQALSRALQRAANVGRGDARSATALRDASQAVAAGQPAEIADALSRVDSALRDAIQASQAQSEVNTTVQRLRDLQTQLQSGAQLRQYAVPSQNGQDQGDQLLQGTPVALDATSGQTLRDPTTGSNAQGAGIDAAGVSGSGTAAPAVQPAENVFVPGRPGNGPADQPQELVNQAFSVRGAPRPYRDVLNQYAQSSRDYVDRPDISPAVRDLVKQYFQELEQGE